MRQERATACLSRVLIFAVCEILLTSFSAAASADTAWVKIKANTTDEIIDALWTASRTGTPTTIAVAPGHYIFAQIFDTGVGPGVLPPVSSSIKVVGTGAGTTTLDAQSNGRICTVTKGGRLVVRNLTLMNGSFESDDVSLGGGAAANFGGFLRFDDCLLVRNVTGAANGALGGAILNVGGQLHVEHTVLMNNRVDGSGGAIALIGGSAIIRNSIIQGNQAWEIMGPGGAGGAIFASKEARLTISGSTVAGNRAGDIGGLSRGGSGGGISSHGTLWMSDSAVIENGVEYTGEGGGIWNRGVMSIKNSTVGANYAGEFGGGIFNRGKLTLQGVTIADNEVQGHVFSCDPGPCTGGGGVWSVGIGRIRTVRSVLAGNRNPFGAPESVGPDCAGVVLSDGYNAVGDASGCDLRPSWVLQGMPTNDQINIDPRIGELQDNGEPGNAHFPLLELSPLIDAGGRISNICTALDQIGQRRVDGDGDLKRKCDIGAIEYQVRY